MPLLQYRIDGPLHYEVDEQRRVMREAGEYLHQGEMTSMDPRRITGNYDVKK